MNIARAAPRALTLPALAVLGVALAISTLPARAQSGLAAVRGDRASGWLAQSRSEVLARNGMVATSQPLAAEAGLRILEKGGNAFDASVAAAAVLNVVEPGSAGIGGDVFVIAWLAREGRLIALNGSGRAPSGATPEHIRAHMKDGRMPLHGISLMER